MEKIRITGIGSELQGVGRTADGRAIFIAGALPGELVDADIIEEKKRYCEGRLRSVLEPSPLRAEPECPLYGACGGCQARHMRYEASLMYKRQRVEDALTRIGGLEGVKVLETLGDPERGGSRNKAEFAVGQDELGKRRVGMRAERSHRVIPTSHCALQHPAINRALAWLNAHIDAFDAAQWTQVVLRATRAGQTMLVICAGAPVRSSVEKLVPLLQKELPQVVSVWFLLQNHRPAHALDGRIEHIWGERVLHETLLGLEYEISPLSFFQVNPVQTEALYRCAVEAALTGLNAPARLLDAYCGAGTITLSLARHGHHVTGAEIVAPAIEDAKRNAQRNHLEKQTRFFCGDAPKIVCRLTAAKERFDAAVLDPPRKGAEAALLNALADARVSRIVYVSCNPATLARDCTLLSERGYRAEFAQPVDMFPWTGHVETVCLLTHG